MDHLLLHGTTATLMRDKLKKEWFAKRIKLHEIKDRLCKLEIPEFLRSQIIQMSEYRKYDRIKDCIEEAMFDAVCYHIVKELMEQQKIN